MKKVFEFTKKVGKIAFAKENLLATLGGALIGWFILLIWGIVRAAKGED